MNALLFSIIESLSLAIGLIGITIILLGSIKGFTLFLERYPKSDFKKIRLILNSHIILGLDFLVGKDIIDTILLSPGESFWKDITGLIAVVFIRIILTHFMEKEIETLEGKTAQAKKTRKKRS